MRIESKFQGEIGSLEIALKAFQRQPREAWPRMLEWLNGRIASDLSKPETRPSLEIVPHSRQGHTRRSA